MIQAEAICPDWGVERADYEGPAYKWLPRCPSCGSIKEPRIIGSAGTALDEETLQRAKRAMENMK